jgi:hypothetical protein
VLPRIRSAALSVDARIIVVAFMSHENVCSMQRQMGLSFPVFPVSL